LILDSNGNRSAPSPPPLNGAVPRILPRVEATRNRSTEVNSGTSIFWVAQVRFHVAPDFDTPSRGDEGIKPGARESGSGRGTVSALVLGSDGRRVGQLRRWWSSTL